MKVVFVGLVPKPEILTALSVNGFDSDVHKKDSFPDQAADILVLAVKNTSTLKALSQWHKTNPQAWIAVCVEKAWIKIPEHQNALLQCPDRNEVWFQESWETSFWFSVQQITRFRALRAEVEALRRERDQWRKDYEDLSRASNELIEQFNRNVELATNLQRSLLPKVSPTIPGVSVSVKYIPASGSGGDYYDIFEFGDHKRFGVLIADSDNHGLAASLLAALLKVRLEEMKERFPDSKSFMEFLNREINPFDPADTGSLSLLYGILDRTSLQFQYTTAGRLQPFLWRNGSQVALTSSPNPALGQMTQYDFQQCTVSLRPGDLLILHTDGLEAALGKKGHSGFDQIASILARKGHSPDPLELQNELMGLIGAHIEKNPLKDDLTLIHFAVNEKALYLAKENKN